MYISRYIPGWITVIYEQQEREERCGEKGGLDWILFVNTGSYCLRLDGRWTRQKGEEFKRDKNLTVMKLGNFLSVRELYFMSDRHQRMKSKRSETIAPFQP